MSNFSVFFLPSWCFIQEFSLSRPWLVKLRVWCPYWKEPEGGRGSLGMPRQLILWPDIGHMETRTKRKKTSEVTLKVLCVCIGQLPDSNSNHIASENFHKVYNPNERSNEMKEHHEIQQWRYCKIGKTSKSHPLEVWRKPVQCSQASLYHDQQCQILQLHQLRI